MKGFIYQGPQHIEMKEIPLPSCGDNDIIVKNIYSGICGSDVTAYKQDGASMRIYPGYEFGHEMVSRVVEVGKNVEDIQVGDRVYPYPMFAKDDTKRSATVGGFSEYVHIPNCKLNHSVYKIDDSISDKVAALMEPFTVGARAAVLSDPKPGQNAIVFGAGVIGMAAAITLKHLGCDKVMLVNRSTAWKSRSSWASSPAARSSRTCGRPPLRLWARGTASWGPPSMQTSTLMPPARTTPSTPSSNSAS